MNQPNFTTMNTTDQFDIVYLPANAHAGGLLPDQVKAFGANINSFWGSADHRMCIPELPIVLDLPQEKARLYIHAKNSTVQQRNYLEVLYSFQPHQQEVGACNWFYMAPREWMT
jgi:hypothetical protein